MAIERPGADIRATTSDATSLRCNARHAQRKGSVPAQRVPKFRDTAWGRPRGQTGWSLRELADRTGINIGVLSRIETSGVTTPRQAAAITAVYDAVLGTDWRRR